MQIHYRQALCDYCLYPMKFKLTNPKTRALLNVQRTRVVSISSIINTITKAQIEKIIGVFGAHHSYYTLYDNARELSKGFAIVKYDEASSAVLAAAYCHDNSFQEKMAMEATLVEPNWLIESTNRGRMQEIAKRVEKPRERQYAGRHPLM